MAFDQRHRFLVAKVWPDSHTAAPSCVPTHPAVALNNSTTSCTHCLSLQLVEAFGLDEVVVEKKLRCV